MNNNDEWDEKGRELVGACQHGRLDDVKRLVAEGVPLNKDYKSGRGGRYSPLLSAIYGDHVEVVRFLLDSEADPSYGE